MRPPPKPKLQGKEALELIEEAIHRLRRSPGLLALYFAGTVPFVIGGLYFWEDMSQSADGYARCAPSSFVLAILFIWMKCWQSAFATRIREVSANRPAAPWGIKRVANLICAQGILQPLGFIVLPVAAVIMLPLAWAAAYYQNLLLYGDGTSGELEEIHRKAWRQASLWPKQNHFLLVFLSFFGLFVFLDVFIAILFVPQLLQMLTGIETAFARGGPAAVVFNTTFFAAAFGLAYLCVDPIMKAAYSLRCFYGESLDTGEDLIGDLHAAPLGRRALALLFFAGFLAALPAGSAAQPAPAPPAVQSVEPRKLDDALARIIEKREYAWRFPREVPKEEAQTNMVIEFFRSVVRMIGRWLHAFGEWVNKLMKWLMDKFGPKMQIGEGDGGGGMDRLRKLLYLLIGVALTIVLLILFQIWRKRKRSEIVAEPVVAGQIPDLTDENIKATDLPVAEWIEIARRLIAEGQFRLALRAFYLASLASLAERELIRIAAFKSNLDYRREITKRAHVHPEILEIFTGQIQLFERVWYGDHAIDLGGLEEFRRGYERIQGYGSK